MDAFLKAIGIVVIAVLTLLIFYPLICLLFAWPVMWTWNYCVPILFKFPEITYWQAFSLMLCITYLFKGGNVKTRE